MTNTQMSESTEANVETAARPEWLPEKFESPEALAQAYAALETKMGSTPPAESSETAAPPPVATRKLSTEAAAELAPDTPAEPPAPVGSAELQQYAQEYASTGQLSEESRATLNAQFGESVVNQYLAGVQAQAELHTTRVYDAAGGVEEYATLARWALNNLPNPDRAAFDEVVDSGDTAAAVRAVEGLKQKYQEALGAPPSLIDARRDPGGIQPFEDMGELARAQADPRYTTDSAYRDLVYRRVALSNF